MYICVCLCACACVHMCVCIHECQCVHECVHVYVYVRMCVCWCNGRMHLLFLQFSSCCMCTITDQEWAESFSKEQALGESRMSVVATNVCLFVCLPVCLLAHV